MLSGYVCRYTGYTGISNISLGWNRTPRFPSPLSYSPPYLARKQRKGGTSWSICNSSHQYQGKRGIVQVFNRVQGTDLVVSKVGMGWSGEPT